MEILFDFDTIEDPCIDNKIENTDYSCSTSFLVILLAAPYIVDLRVKLLVLNLLFSFDIVS